MALDLVDSEQKGIIDNVVSLEKPNVLFKLFQDLIFLAFVEFQLDSFLQDVLVLTANGGIVPRNLVHMGKIWPYLREILVVRPCSDPLMSYLE